MALNKVQQDFVNNALRPAIERTIQNKHYEDTFIADYDAIQASADALPEDATILDDAGDAPRSDAPTLTGIQGSQLRSLLAARSAVITPVIEETFIGKMVRSLNSVLRIGTR